MPTRKKDTGVDIALLAGKIKLNSTSNNSLAIGVRQMI